MPLCLVAAGALVYHNALFTVFVFDDLVYIKPERLEIQSAAQFFDALTRGTRPVVEISFLANYAFAGMDPLGYKLVNIAVHILAGLTLYGLVRRVQLCAGRPDPTGQAAPWIAGAIALLWLVHPLNTQAVTYTIQRAESMTALFFLLTMYGLVRHAEAPAQRAWAVLAVGACALGMATKPVMFGAPIVALLLDRAFIGGTFKAAFQQRGRLYLALAATWLVLVWVRIDQDVLMPMVAHGGAQGAAANGGGGLPGPSAGFGLPFMNWYQYLLSQGEVILHYLRLSAWPQPLVLDYHAGWKPVFIAWQQGEASRAAWLVPVLVVGLMCMAGVAALVRNWWWGVPVAWFFIVLGPSSSFVPIADHAVEHRMYLPLVALIALVVVLAYLGLRWLNIKATVQAGIGGAAVVVLAVALGSATYARNFDYVSEVRIWGSVVQTEVGSRNGRAWRNYAQALMRMDAFDEALHAFDREVEQLPANAAMTQQRHLRVGEHYLNVHVGGRRPVGALRHFRAVLAQHPRNPQLRTVVYARTFLALQMIERRGGAAQVLPRLDLRPVLEEEARRFANDYYAHMTLALVSALQGDVETAANHQRRAISIAQQAGAGPQQLDALRQQLRAYEGQMPAPDTQPRPAPRQFAP